MKQLQQIAGVAVALCVAALSGCGGTSPAPESTAWNASQFQAALNWPGTGDGALGGNTALGVSAMLVTIPFAGTQYDDIGLISDQVSFGVGLAPPSPLPSSAPVPTPQPSVLLQIRSNPVVWNDSAVTLTADPQWTAMLGPTETVGRGRTAGKSTLTATAAGAPVNVGISATVYTYRVADVGCVDGGALAGAGFIPDANGGHYVAQSDPATSDLYVTGPQCGGKFTDPSGYTLHVPYGGVLTNLDGYPPGEANNGFFTAAPSAWRSSFTQLDESQFELLFAPCSAAPNRRLCFTPLNDILIFKTGTGNVVKMYIALEHHTATSGRNIAGAFEVSSRGKFPF